MAADRLALVVFNGSTLGVGQLKTDSFISPWREARVCTAALKRSISMPYNVTALIFQFLAPNLCDARTQPPKARGTPSSRVKTIEEKGKGDDSSILSNALSDKVVASCCMRIRVNSGLVSWRHESNVVKSFLSSLISSRKIFIAEGWNGMYMLLRRGRLNVSMMRVLKNNNIIIIEEFYSKRYFDISILKDFY